MVEENSIPKHWQIKKLVDVCDEIFAGGDVPKNNFSLTSSEKYQIPIYANGEKNKGLYGYTNVPRVSTPSVTISARGTIGYAEVRNKPFFPIVRLIVLKPNEFLDVLFLKYVIDNCNIKHTGSSIPQLTVPTVKILSIPLPSLFEQQSIVSKIEELLSDLDNGKQQLQTAQQQLKVYRQSLLKWAFEGKLTNKDLKEGELPKSWKVVIVADVCKCIVPNRDKPKSFSGHIKWVTTPNLSSSSIRLNYNDISMGLSEVEVKEYNARVIPVGSVIMTCVGTFGLSAIVEKPIVINQQLHAFLSSEIISSKYLAYCIQNSKHFFEKKSTSTTIQYLNKENCNSMPLPLCSLDEQNRIVEELESKLTVCDKIEETISQSLLQAETLRQSILKKAFEGKLVNLNYDSDDLPETNESRIAAEPSAKYK